MNWPVLASSGRTAQFSSTVLVELNGNFINTNTGFEKITGEGTKFVEALPRNSFEKWALEAVVPRLLRSKARKLQYSFGFSKLFPRRASKSSEEHPAKESKLISVLIKFSFFEALSQKSFENFKAIPKESFEKKARNSHLWRVLKVNWPVLASSEK